MSKINAAHCWTRYPLEFSVQFTLARNVATVATGGRFVGLIAPRNSLRSTFFVAHLKRIFISIPATDTFQRLVDVQCRFQRIKVHPVIGNGSDSFGWKIRDWITVGTQFTGSYLDVTGRCPRYSSGGRKYAKDPQRETNVGTMVAIFFPLCKICLRYHFVDR